MGFRDRLERLEAAAPDGCQACGIKHPTIIISGEKVPEKCPECGGGLHVIIVPSEECKHLVEQIVEGKVTE